MSLAIVGRYYVPSHAEIARSKLDAADIPSFLFDRHINYYGMHMNLAWGGMRLMVCSEDLEVATTLIHEDRVSESEIETESEAFRRNMGFGLFGLLISVFCGWMPIWLRYRKFR